MDDYDSATIQAILDGEVDRYAELVNRYQGQALRLAFSLLGNYEDAKDVSQDAFVSAYRALAHFRRQAKFSTWLYRIIVNACHDVWKRRAHQPKVVAQVGEVYSNVEEDGLFVVEVVDSATGPSDYLANRELSATLNGAINVLPEKQRTAFILHHVHGLQLCEVATVMGCRAGTIKSHIFRATERLRLYLAPWLKQEREVQ